jgi:hypothetical protein
LYRLVSNPHEYGILGNPSILPLIYGLEIPETTDVHNETLFSFEFCVRDNHGYSSGGFAKGKTA